MKLSLNLMLSVFLFTSLFLPLGAGVTRQAQEWLILGPAQVPPRLEDGAVQPGKLLDYRHFTDWRLKPVSGRKTDWFPGVQLQWRKGVPRFNLEAETRTVFMALYLESGSSLHCSLILTHELPSSVFLNGRQLEIHRDVTGGKSQLKLESGKHLLVLKTILPAVKEPTSTDAGVEFHFEDESQASNLAFSLEPERLLKAEDILEAVDIEKALLNSDGSRAAVFLSQYDVAAENTSRWLEIMETRNGRLLYSSRPAAAPAGFQWHPDPNRFSFQQTRQNKTDLLVFDLTDLSQRTILSGVSDFSHYVWSAGGDYLLYATQQAAHPETSGYRLHRDPDQKSLQPPRLYNWTLLYPESSVQHPISSTAGAVAEVLPAPDNQTMYLVRRENVFSDRPFSKTTVLRLQIPEMNLTELFSDPWINQVLVSADGRRLLLTGGPSAFGGLGNVLPPEVIPNDFDAQAYLFDPETGRTTALSRNFAPSIQRAAWLSRQGPLFLAGDRDYIRLYRLVQNRGVFQQLDAAVDVIAGFSASRGNTVLYWGSSPAVPQKIYVMDSASGRSRLLRDYNRELFSGISLGRVDTLQLKISEQRTLHGHLYYPARFDPNRRYPCIFYYYGGTSPVYRDFGGRYPKAWYAANGYFVYVPQPQGATGFGQDSSSRHVNDWGQVSSAEIIAAVPELLKAVPAIDGSRLGAMGASYGGFLTQYLAASTDLFSAYVSHAGISSLSSYWGTGDWGYSYSAVASAESFPWNRKDLYVGHSPLFMADRIKTPMLLLHGDRDNNVPPGESHQMYTALKLLGREVALVTFADQLHFVLEPEKRLRWMKTIIAWFDRWLKDEGRFWEDLYPEG